MSELLEEAQKHQEKTTNVICLDFQGVSYRVLQQSCSKLCCSGIRRTILSHIGMNGGNEKRCVSLQLMETCKQGGPSRDFCWASLVNMFIDNLEE